MITLEDYFMGRDKKYSKDLSGEIVNNAKETVKRANLLLIEFEKVFSNAKTRKVSSGWRPPAVNAGTKNAARRSHHMTGKAIDISDNGNLAKWCASPAGLIALEKIGLWLEHPGSTLTWCHVQTVPPRSGNRVFYP